MRLCPVMKQTTASLALHAEERQLLHQARPAVRPFDVAKSRNREKGVTRLSSTRRRSADGPKACVASALRVFGNTRRSLGKHDRALAAKLAVMPSTRAMRHNRSEPLPQSSANNAVQTPLASAEPWPIRAYSAGDRTSSRYITLNRSTSWIPDRLRAGKKLLKFHNMTRNAKSFKDTTADRLQAMAINDLVDNMEALFGRDYDAEFLVCMARTNEWQQEQRRNMTDSRPFLAYYRILKYLSPGSCQTSGSQQPDTSVQRRFMAWVQHWVDDEDFKQHVQPVWDMLSEIKRNWQHEAERDGAWDIEFVHIDKPLSEQWQSAEAVQNVPVQQFVAGSAAHPSPGQQSATALRAAEMQEGLMASALLQLPAHQHFDEHDTHTGNGQEYVHEHEQPAGQDLDNELQSPWSTSSPYFVQQNAVPRPQDFMPSQQDAMPDQQGSIPDQQGSVPDQQGSMPGQQGAMPGQQGSVPDQQGAVPGQQGLMPGQQGSVPDQQGAVPGQQGAMPDQQVAVPGQQGLMPCQQGAMPGQQMRLDADLGIIQAGQMSTDTRGVHTPVSSIQADDGTALQLAEVSGDLLGLQFAEVSGDLLARYSKWKVKRDAASHAMLHCLRNMALGHYMQGSEADLAHANQYLTEALHLCKQMPVRLTGNATNADLVMKIGLVYELANVNFAFMQPVRSAVAQQWLEEGHRLVDEFVAQQAVRPASMHTHTRLCKEMLWAAHCARSRNDVKGASYVLNGLTRVLTTTEARGLLLYLPHLQLQSASCSFVVVCAAVILAFYGYGWQVVLFLSLLAGLLLYWLNGIKLN